MPTDPGSFLQPNSQNASKLRTSNSCREKTESHEPFWHKTCSQIFRVWMGSEAVEGAGAYEERVATVLQVSFVSRWFLALSRRLPWGCANSYRTAQSQVAAGSSPSLTSFSHWLTNYFFDLEQVRHLLLKYIFRYEERQLCFSCLTVYLDR